MAGLPVGADEPGWIEDVRAALPAERPHVRGKFLWLGAHKLLLRGVTYGTFRPDPQHGDWPPLPRVAADFSGMAAAGFNLVRTYVVPPREVLDVAADHGLFVLVGLPWEQHIAFLEERGRAGAIARSVRAGVAACAGHPAVLGYAVGNEIPASIVRWHGRRRVERFLTRLVREARAADPGGLVTYVNFPTTEYLDLPGLDFCAFNVYLEAQADLAAYLARLQIVAGDRPLLMTEIGLDSRRNGEAAQAESLAWQLDTATRAGCAGTTIFAWTDEWHRGGHEIDDWDFGLVRRDRTPKPALAAVRAAFLRDPLPAGRPWPRVSVVICSYNGSATIARSVACAAALHYPDVEVIVVDDGSTDGTGDIALAAGARVISTSNRGLSSARNTGLAAAGGELVAYLDDDAWPDPDWLRHAAATLMSTDHVAVGGPNLPPGDDGLVADAVAAAPGGPTHVLLTDTVAEHIPGCNMVFRRDALAAIGGFDPQFRVAGDDVDICWRLQANGWTIAFCPAAFVWHRRRTRVRDFWRQQRAYGASEARLERKWPDKYNRAGHVGWSGHVYGPTSRRLLQRWRVYYGVWGSGSFQRLYHDPLGGLGALPLMPEWLLLLLALTAAAAARAIWPSLPDATPLLVAASGVLMAHAWHGAGCALHRMPRRTGPGRLALHGLTALLFVLQAAARLRGRLAEGLSPWRRPRWGFSLPRRRTEVVWSEEWASPEDRLHAVEHGLRRLEVPIRRGGEHDRWDLAAHGGPFGSTHLLMAVEEHGSGRQLLRFALRPTIGHTAGSLAVFLTGAAVACALTDFTGIAVVLAAGVAAIAAGAAADAGRATSAVVRVLRAGGLEAVAAGEVGQHAPASPRHAVPAIGVADPGGPA